MKFLKYTISFVLVLGIMQSQAQENYKVQNLKFVNSEHLDFSPVPFKKGILFTSTRDNDCRCKDRMFDDNYTDIYYADIRTHTVLPLQGELNGKYHDGVATPADNGSKIFLTRTNTKGKRKDGFKDSKIYEFQYKNEQWEKVGEFPYNSNEYATCHPTVSRDGKTLYFASNRPGTLGGMDIWMSRLDNGKWSEPQNLGSQVNTEKNEVFPFVNAENELFFASNGQKGARGLDIYKATGEGFTSVRALGEPFNTVFDDFGFSSNEDGSMGYFSSDRLDGMGGDDIYYWIKEGGVPPAAQPTSIIIVDALTQQTIQGPTTTILRNSSSLGTKNEGQFSLTADKEPVYTFEVSASGYEPTKVSLSGRELATVTEYKIPMRKAAKKSAPFQITVISASTKELLPDSKVIVEKLCNGQRNELVASNSGTVSIDLECGCQVRVTTIKSGYVDAVRTYPALDCQNPTSANYQIEMTAKAAPAKFEGTEIKKGAVITLNDIYYDYNKYNIRSDAEKVLNKVVDLMQKYPTLEIELASHTDCRGNNEYNQTLSQNRAESAVNYIIRSGVSSNRLKAAGYGESQTVNGCIDGVKCSEQQHQQNRRTEIRVLNFNETDIQIIKN